MMANKPISMTFKDLEAHKASSQNAASANKKGTQNSGLHQIPESIVQYRDVHPIKIAVGKVNIRADGSTAAILGSQSQGAFKELADLFRDYVAELEAFLPQDLAGALEPTMELSLGYCPVDTGELYDSAYLAVESYRGGARVEMGYGRGGQPDYAIFVHEMPYKHAAPTRDKFLEVAIDEDYFNIVQRVSNNIRVRSGAF